MDEEAEKIMQLRKACLPSARVDVYVNHAVRQVRRSLKAQQAGGGQ